MMVLALDTATTAVSAALVDGRRVLAEMQLAGRKNHSERLVGVIDQLLAWAGIDVAALDLIAVSAGPGSFTGLRVGISTAQGLAFALGAPLAGVPTLEVLACQAAVDGGCVSPMIDARKGQVYAALYRMQAGVAAPVLEAAACDPAAWIAALPEPAVLIGTGAAVYADPVARAAAAKGCSVAPHYLAFPRACTVAALAQERYAAEAGRPELVRPLYVRPPDALIG